MKNFQVLSIDAWWNKKEGYEWNQWYKIGTVPESTLDLRGKALLDTLLELGIINVSDLRITEIEIDDLNIVLLDKKTQRPLIAIEHFGSIEQEGAV